MNTDGMREIVIPKYAPIAMRIQETPWFYRRTNKHTITYEWWCRGCLLTNRIKIESVDPLYELRCSQCGSLVYRDCVENDWHTVVPIKTKEEK